MIKVLIVDDEPKLREGLRSIVPWNELGFQIVDTAANGNEALEKHGFHAPEVMVVDIRMPRMDGLQLIEAIRKVDSKVHLLILSGYADFEYAQRAISHQVDGYLLKPVDEAELAAYLVQVKGKIEEERELSTLSQINVEGNREQLIQALIKEGGIDEGKLRSAERLGLVWEYYQVLLVHIHGSDEVGQELDMAMKQKLVEIFEKKGRGVVFSKNTYLGVLLPIRVHTEMGRQELYKELDLAASEVGVVFTSAVGLHVHGIERIASSYRSAYDRIRQRFFYHSGGLLFPGAVRFGGDIALQNEPVYNSKLLIDKVYYAVDVGNDSMLRPLIESVLGAMIQEGYTEERIKNSFMELLTGVHGKLTKYHSELHSKIKESSDRIAAVYRQRSVYDLFDHTVQFFGDLMWQAGKGGRDQEMKRVIDLIHRNYSENMKLETLASVFNYNSAYLGKMFKNTTGEYFNTYLDKVRIDEAKNLLKQGMKVYEVAEKVGYTSVDYFHSKFKKYVGTSPTNYRKESES